ncbi:lysophospholipid acyltransferase family protein [Actinomyces qiguomingii]|uniref:lysophospholipid acyltransferase family protein n=1 Tax=Actinomyces qiguomingii TaxID=2057800 RepID=UPI000CA05AC9|nr:lysophospholipid acyltransferase family protein [Actinomyces qiguomingii]
MTPFYRFAARGVIIPFLKAVSKQHVTGTANIPREGGFVAVANHLSNLDPLTAMRSLVDVDVPIYSLAKSQLFEIPLLGRVFSAGGQIPVYRDSANAGNSLVEAERRLREGDPIMIFPEGTLSRDPLQWPMTGKTGAARLAMRTGAPVLPMGQWGAHKVLGTYGGFHPFPRKDVRVVIGEPFDLVEYGSDVSDYDAVRAATAEIMRRITELVEQLRGEKAPRPFDMKYDGDPGKGNIGVRRPDPPISQAPSVDPDDDADGSAGSSERPVADAGSGEEHQS